MLSQCTLKLVGSLVHTSRLAKSNRDILTEGFEVELAKCMWICPGCDAQLLQGHLIG